MKPGDFRFSEEVWQRERLPFFFRYGGEEGGSVLSGWTRHEESQASPEGERRSIRWSDGTTGLEVTAEIRFFAEYGATDWVLRFANRGSVETPLLEGIQPLHWQGHPAGERVELHYAMGSELAANDFENRSAFLWNGSFQRLHSTGGRSSRNHLPFFNVEAAGGGIIGAVGWTGNWEAVFRREWDGGITFAAGMQRTRFRLRPGEEVRTPRILLMNWQGSRVDAHNAWRRLLLAHYVPKENGAVQPLPAAYCVWGTDTTERHLARAEHFAAAKVPVETYWIDAGWYGSQPVVENATVFNTAWGKNRGNWRPSPDCYPQGLKPLSDGLRALGMNLLLWFETEVADASSEWANAHPGWFLPGGEALFLDLGNPEARRGVTEFLSRLFAEQGVAWYRQDFNLDPEACWALADAPDRIGMAEIRHVEGLYAFWDELLRRHPGLRIDNCSSGGRRIDLETLSRSFPLWRSDYQCNPSFDPVGSQRHGAGLFPWVPMSAGVVGWPDTYGLRSAYSAGLAIEGGMCGAKEFPTDWLRAAMEEFLQVRPFFQGDYYPIKGAEPFDASLIAWQFHRPDLAAGVLVVLCRRYLPKEPSILNLSAIEPEAVYDVEIRHELGQGRIVPMTGAELAAMTVDVAERPGSAVILYRRK